MPLLDLWASNPSTIAQFSIEQVVTSAGNGALKDDSECSRELRSYLAEVPSTKLASYINHCLTTSFNKGGMVLQDLVNELGRRLDYKVTNGRYQGTSNRIGYDGIWTSPEGQSIVVEVKTTDAYRISLDTIAGYRDKLIAAQETYPPCSILIVVGREDTGELEAQIRGSRQAWDIRLISTDALVKLVELKEHAEEPETGRKIRGVLVPMEFTRLDGLIDVMFTTAKDVESAAGVELGADEESEGETSEQQKAKGTWQFTDSGLLQAKREEVIAAFASREATTLIRKSRALYWNSTHEVRAACTISKRYERKGGSPYWYAYHPAWDEFLDAGKRSFIILGCMDRDSAFAVPLNIMRSVLDALNTSEKEGGDHYWHIHLQEKEPGQISLTLPKRKSVLSLTPYRFSL